VNPQPLLQRGKGLPQDLKQIYRIKKIQKEKLRRVKCLCKKQKFPKQKKSEAGKGKELETPLEIPESFSKKVGGISSRELGSPINSLTPLQSTYGNPHEGALYVSDPEPISRDDIPSSNYFFNKKRKAILKQ
jgi:hypothetical protein